MFLDLKKINVFMMIAPHPDDEALGCSGTLLKLKQENTDSTIVYLTDGECLYGEASDVVRGKRREEAKKVSRKNASFLGLPDGNLGESEEVLYQNLRDQIVEISPDILFSPSLIDFHPDHITAARVILRIHNELRTFRLAFYEVYETLRFTHLVDITDVIEEKKKAILNYRSSLYEKPVVYVHASLGLNAQRSIFVQREGYYEAFYLVNGFLTEDEIISHICYR